MSAYLDRSYDPRAVFDDIYGDAADEEFYGIVTGDDLLHAARQIAHRAHKRRLKTTPVVVGDARSDSTMRTFKVGDVQYSLIGDEPIGRPVFDDLHQRFAAALPQPKLVRLDTPESYAEFRAARRAPYLAALEMRLAALEEAFNQHVADGHSSVDILGRDVITACGEAHWGGEEVWLPLPDWARGKIDCWRDGPEILCTVRLPAADAWGDGGGGGGLRLATSATQLNGCFDEVVGCAIDTDVGLEELMVVGPPLAQVLGADKLVRELCGAARELVARANKRPFVGVMSSASDPSVAAAMALLQRCQRGDPRAREDAVQMLKSHGELLGDARERLLTAQHEKKRRLS